MKWEYLVTFIGDDTALANTRLSEKGDEGWELVSVQGHVAYFRRRKQPIHIGPSETKEVPYV